MKSQDTLGADLGFQKRGASRDTYIEVCFCFDLLFQIGTGRGAQPV